jgi:hypothetical protein
MEAPPNQKQVQAVTELYETTTKDTFVAEVYRESELVGKVMEIGRLREFQQAE